MTTLRKSRQAKGGDSTLSDYELITHKFPERQDIRIYPIADVHLGAAEHLEREWSSFCANLLNDPNAYITLGGDLINNATKNSVSNVYEERLRPREQKQIMVEMLTPLRDRILCAVPGNHEWRSARDVDDEPTYDIMCKLDLEHLYRQNIAFVKLQFGDNRKGQGTKNPTYVLAITHGTGGGIFTGAAVNRAERFGYVLDGVDGLICGHTHKPFVTAPEKLKVNPQKNIVARLPFVVVNATSWTAYGGYAARKMFLPSGYRPQVLTLHGREKAIEVAMRLTS